ncbi:preprotein translocase subunit SecG [Candidatus Gottesmanbacteria bacterium]|nr:preprotein translocase subunit SecG [Candidatus Gottesmanbacteria bacterium]
MKIVLLILQVLLSGTLMALILLQSSKGGLGGGLGGGQLYRTKRGAEKLIFTSTIVVAVLFLLTSLINVAVN